MYVLYIFARFISQCFIIFDTDVDDTVFLISNFSCSLLVYKRAIDFCILIFYPTIFLPEILFMLISSIQLLSRVCLFVTLWTAALQASLSITNYQSPLKLMSIEWVMPSNHLILCCPLLFPLQSFPASGSFLMSCSSHEVAKVLELQL